MFTVSVEGFHGDDHADDDNTKSDQPLCLFRSGVARSNMTNTAEEPVDGRPLLEDHAGQEPQKEDG